VHRVIRRRILNRLTGYGVEDPEICTDLLMTIPEVRALVTVHMAAEDLLKKYQQAVRSLQQ
jgi:hypothetical protein